MLKIFGKASSINVRKVLWLCAELELPYELEQWGSGFRSTDTPEFLAMNPNAQVPVIQSGSFVLWQSNTICRYLAAHCKRTDLLPVSPQERAIVEQWMDWQATELNNAWRYAFMALVRKSPAHTDAGAIQVSIDEWTHYMGILELQLSETGRFVTGNSFTLADIVIGLSINRWLMTPFDHPVFPAISTYFQKLCDRAAFLAHGNNGIP
jgi:glutathione S-transferase